MPRHPPERETSRLFPLLCVAALAMGSLAGASLAGVAQGAEAPGPDPIEVFVDAVLIDARCRDARIDFGAVMRYGQDRGLPASNVLPLGPRRPTFDAVLKRRTQGIETQDLCGAVAARQRALGLVKPT